MFMKIFNFMVKSDVVDNITDSLSGEFFVLADDHDKERSVFDERVHAL